MMGYYSTIQERKKFQVKNKFTQYHHLIIPNNVFGTIGYKLYWVPLRDHKININ